MKKQVVMAATALMLASSFAGGLSSQETEAASKKVVINKKNFPDSVFRELVKSNYDKNKDGKLSTSEIKKAKKFGSSSCKTSVKVKNSKYGKYTKKYVKDIKNFKGVEKLTNLQKFVANETSVKTVNFKKNKNLTYLEMTDGKLQKLDLNSNKKLKYVYLQYNQLTSLKISKCKKLLYVDLKGHMVPSLKIDRNKKTEVLGEDYFAPFKKQTITATLNAATGGMIDASGKYCIYEWAPDNSSCQKKSLNGTSMETTSVVLNAETVAKTKAMQKIAAQWQDAQGNFYFVADKDGDMVAHTVYYIYKINPQGAIESEVKLNNQIKVNEYGNYFSMNYLGLKDNVVVLGVTSNNGVNGVVYFDTTAMKAIKQGTCSFIPKSAEGDVVAGVSTYGFDVAISKMSNGTKEKLENGEEIEICKLGDGHLIPMPLRKSDMPYSLQVQNNYIYYISGEGFYKAKLTADKFSQLYGVGKFSYLQDRGTGAYLTMKSEKEIYLLTNKTSEDSTTYALQSGTIA